MKHERASLIIMILIKTIINDIIITFLMLKVTNDTHYLHFMSFPVKHVTRILMEIPYHFSSQLDLVAVWSKSTPNSMTFPCHLSRFCLFSMLEHDMDFGQVQVMEFPWHVPGKCDGISIRVSLIFDQTSLKKT